MTTPWLFGLLAVTPLLAAAAFGWLTPRASWSRATGWRRIPDAPAPRRRLQVVAESSPGAGDGEEAELDWLGHAGFRLRWQGVTLLVDPNLSGWCTISRRRLAPLAAASAVGPVDATLLTHGHRDHLDLPTLAALPDPGVLVVPRGGEGWLAGLARRRERRSCGRGRPTRSAVGREVGQLAERTEGRADASAAAAATGTAGSGERTAGDAAAPSAGRPGPAVVGAALEVVGLTLGATLRIGALEVTTVDAHHGGSRSHPFRVTGGGPRAVGYLVRPVLAPPGRRPAILFAGDTAWGPHFAEIAHALAPTVAVLPIGAFAPRWPLRHYHLSPEEAVAAGRALGVATVVPCHFGTFLLSFDRPSTALPRFARAAAAAGLDWVMPRLLDGRVAGEAAGPGRVAIRAGETSPDLVAAASGSAALSSGRRVAA